MKRKVLLTPEEKQDIEAAYLHIRADAPETARRFLFASNIDRLSSCVLRGGVRVSERLDYGAGRRGTVS